MRLDSALCGSVGNASDLPAHATVRRGEFQHMRARLALCEQCGKPTRLVLAGAASAPARRPIQSCPATGLPSSRESVSKSCTTLCMREACCDIMPR